MDQFLRLVSTGDGPLQGWTKDPDWRGWIPVLSSSFRSDAPVSYGSSSGAREVPKEISVSVKSEDLDVARLYQWAARATPATATFDFVPDAVGKEGWSLILRGAYVTSVKTLGNLTTFSLNFSEKEFRYLLRFR